MGNTIVFSDESQRTKEVGSITPLIHVYHRYATQLVELVYPYCWCHRVCYVTERGDPNKVAVLDYTTPESNFKHRAAYDIWTFFCLGERRYNFRDIVCATVSKRGTRIEKLLMAILDSDGPVQLESVLLQEVLTEGLQQGVFGRFEKEWRALQKLKGTVTISQDYTDDNLPPRVLHEESFTHPLEMDAVDQEEFVKILSAALEPCP